MKYTDLILFSSIASGVLFGSYAFADCADVGSAQWKELSRNMGVAYDAGKYPLALEHAKSLTIICNRSPIVNYTMSEIYRNMGNEDESYVYVRRASEYIQDYPTSQAVVEKIWMRRAEFELPYKKDLEKLQSQLDIDGQLGAEVQAYKKRLESTEAENAKAQDALSTSYETVRRHEIDTLTTLKWVGAGGAIAGLAMTAAGIGLMAYGYNEADKAYGENWSDFDKYDSIEHTGIGVMTAGIGLGVLGSVVAIYSHIKIKSVGKPLNDQETASFMFNISPQSVSLGMTF